MTAPVGSAPPVRPLPFQVRPRAGEGGASFITRLAHANYLPPGYLRRFLAESPFHTGTPSWARLAALTGRDPGTLRAILETRQCQECGARMPPTELIGRRALFCSSTCRSQALRGREAMAAPCRICQQPMKVQIGQRHRLCSSACRRTAYLRKKRSSESADSDPDVRSDPTAADRAAGHCVTCERSLPPHSRTSRRFCSATCQKVARRWDRIARRGQPTSACEFCQEPLSPVANRSSAVRRWCSRRCRKRVSWSRDPASHIQLTCENCRTLFTKGSFSASSRWCSPACRLPVIRQRKPLKPAAVLQTCSCLTICSWSSGQPSCSR